MEEGVSLLGRIRDTFGLKETALTNYSSLALAFVGDSIYDLIIRTAVAERHHASNDRLHQEKSELVKAQTQARMGLAIWPYLTQEEEGVYRRGRNAKPHSTAKHASLSEYKMATGLEALYGYLYLAGREERLLELIDLSMKELGLAI